ncbi:MAG TPA: malto-oligosyltrehalose synthase, partial [Myxococcota bacterium]|nr:malto-oligosyltrehalose synthase [Myxococcota bacterium]
TRTSRSFAEVARAAKRRAMGTILRPELERAVRALAAVAPAAGPLEPRTARKALVAFASHLEVYRVYPRPGGLDAPGRRRVRDALAKAADDGAPRAGLDALRRLLLSRTRAAARIAAARRVQQLCVSAAAKGVEDTAFYAHAPVLSRAEVGGEPGRPLGDPVAAFHAAMAARAKRPRGLSAGSTHDTKRSADVRARLDVLSERPEAWLAAVDRWHHENATLRRRCGGPDAATELLFYQTLVGVWPLAGRASTGADERRTLADRLVAYMEKATREAERRTSWLRPDARFERALSQFVRGALLPRGGRSAFLDDVDRFAGEVTRPGLWNALARRLLQLAAPGVPDLYQGDELWCFDLVDPDNRRRVDFAARARVLDAVERVAAADRGRRLDTLRAWVRRPEDGRLALYVTRRGLAARRAAPELFVAGGYEPVRVVGEGAHEVLAFLRRRGRRAALAVVPRLAARRAPEPGAAPVGAAAWGDTRLVLPRGLARRRLTCWLTGRGRAADRDLPLGEALDTLPVGLWMAGPGSRP